MPHDFLALAGVFQLDPSSPLPHPVEEELSRPLADTPLRLADLHVERAGRGEAKRLRIVDDRSHQEPAALAEPNGAQLAGPGHLLDRDLSLHLAVLDDLHKANRVSTDELRPNVEDDFLALWGREDVA